MRTLNFWVVALSVGLFLAITYVLCVAFGFVAPEQFRMYRVWESLLPGFVWFSWGSFFLGLVESFLYGLYVAAVFVPLYNWLAGRLARP